MFTYILRLVVSLVLVNLVIACSGSSKEKKNDIVKEHSFKSNYYVSLNKSPENELIKSVEFIPSEGINEILNIYNETFAKNNIPIKVLNKQAVNSTFIETNADPKLGKILSIQFEKPKSVALDNKSFIEEFKKAPKGLIKEAAQSAMDDPDVKNLKEYLTTYKGKLPGIPFWFDRELHGGVVQTVYFYKEGVDNIFYSLLYKGLKKPLRVLYTGELKPVNKENYIKANSKFINSDFKIYFEYNVSSALNEALDDKNLLSACDLYFSGKENQGICQKLVNQDRLKFDGYEVLPYDSSELSSTDLPEYSTSAQEYLSKINTFVPGVDFVEAFPVISVPNLDLDKYARESKVLCESGECPPFVGTMIIKISSTDVASCSFTKVSSNLIKTNRHCLPDELQLSHETDICKNLIKFVFPPTEFGDGYGKEISDCEKVVYKTNFDIRGDENGILNDMVYLSISNATSRPSVSDLNAFKNLDEDEEISATTAHFWASNPQVEGEYIAKIIKKSCKINYRKYSENHNVKDGTYPLIFLNSCDQDLIKGNSGSGLFLEQNDKLLLAGTFSHSVDQNGEVNKGEELSGYGTNLFCRPKVNTLVSTLGKEYIEPHFSNDENACKFVSSIDYNNSLKNESDRDSLLSENKDLRAELSLLRSEKADLSSELGSFKEQLENLRGDLIIANTQVENLNGLLKIEKSENVDSMLTMSVNTNIEIFKQKLYEAILNNSPNLYSKILEYSSTKTVQYNIFNTKSIQLDYLDVKIDYIEANTDQSTVDKYVVSLKFAGTKDRSCFNKPSTWTGDIKRDDKKYNIHLANFIVAGKASFEFATYAETEDLDRLVSSRFSELVITPLEKLTYISDDVEIIQYILPITLPRDLHKSVGIGFKSDKDIKDTLSLDVSKWYGSFSYPLEINRCKD